jgi:hypothetical protein
MSNAESGGESGGLRQGFLQCQMVIADCHAGAQNMKLEHHRVVREFRVDEPFQFRQFLRRYLRFSGDGLIIEVIHVRTFTPLAGTRCREWAIFSWCLPS